MYINYILIYQIINQIVYLKKQLLLQYKNTTNIVRHIFMQMFHTIQVYINICVDRTLNYIVDDVERFNSR